MIKLSRYSILSVMLVILCGGYSLAQDNPVVLDKVVGVVGQHSILESEIQTQYLQYRAQEFMKGSKETMTCAIMEEMLYAKLLLNQAALDSVEVGDSQVEAEMDRRLRYFISQFGSEEKFEEFYGKSIIAFKDELRKQVKDQMLIQTVQQNLTAEIKVTPSQVSKFYRSIPVDSIPLINSQVEITQLVKLPPVSMEEKNEVKSRLVELRKRILEGENFKTLAILYSQDPGSARNGGELGLVGRGELYPDFEAVAFSLKEGEISDIVETEAGFHIIQMIERKGDFVNVRHILLQPKVSTEDLIKAKQELDSIAGLIDEGKYTFEEAVAKFSDDPSKNNGGIMINPMTNTALFDADQLDPSVFFVIDKLEVGEISSPVIYKTQKNQDAYRILKLKKRTDPHKANLTQDYDRIQEWALEDAKNKFMRNWINEKIEETYIKVDPAYHNCDFLNSWISSPE